MRAAVAVSALLTIAFCLAAVTNEPPTASRVETNGAGVYRTWVTYQTNAVLNPRFGYTNHLAASNRLPAEVYQKLVARWAREPQFVTNVVAWTNAEFVRFVPESLNHILLTNFTLRTNGRATQMWARREHPFLWPLAGPRVEWNERSLIWGMKGMTALSPCWEQEGAHGQVPVTLITRRHGYTRGHGMGPDGFRRTFSGKKVWFVTRDNKVIEAKVSSAVVRATVARRDYTILMFSEDLPDSIEHLRVASESTVREHYPWPTGSTPVVLRTEQGGHVSTDLPELKVPSYKGGDSGSPNLLPLFNELVFIGGRTTSPPSPLMQEDIDELCRREKVDPQRYQLRWVDLSAYPKY